MSSNESPKDLATLILEAAAEEELLQQQQTWPPATAPNPKAVALIDLIGPDEVLLEAAIGWVRTKKSEITIAKLKVLYTPKEFEAFEIKAGLRESPSNDEQEVAV